MSNSSLKEQLQAVASQLSDTVGKPQPAEQLKRKAPPADKAKPSVAKPRVDRAYDKAKKPKPKWLDYAQYGVELLRVYFPACFKSANEVKPLKTGIKQDLLIRLGSIETIVIDDKACMVKSLAYYVNTATYHKSVVEGAARVDLDGNPAGVVTAEEAKYSLERQENKLLAKKSGEASVRTSQVKEEATV
jgi:ProP effector